MKKDIANYVKDNGGHLSEDMVDSTQSHKPCKSLKQIYSRVEEFKKYFVSCFVVHQLLTDSKFYM